MGEYNEKWFSFSVRSKRHVLDLIIEPSFAKAVCFQVHEMRNNFFQLFWNYGMVSREIFPLLMKYAEIQKIDPKTAVTKVCDSEEFAEFVRENAPKIFIADLSEDDMTLVNAVINANWTNAKRRYGLDGHSYKITIYGEPVREYEFYCCIYEEQKELVTLVKFLVDIAKLEPRNCYDIHGVESRAELQKKILALQNDGVAKKIVDFDGDGIVYEDGSKLYVNSTKK